MRIRFSFTINITRDREPQLNDEPPHVDDRGYSATEHAGHQRIGFQIQPTNPQDPFEYDDGRQGP